MIDFARWWHVEVKAEAIGQDVGARLIEKSRKLERSVPARFLNEVETFLRWLREIRPRIST